MQSRATDKSRTASMTVSRSKGSNKVDPVKIPVKLKPFLDQISSDKNTTVSPCHSVTLLENSKNTDFLAKSKRLAKVAESRTGGGKLTFFTNSTNRKTARKKLMQTNCFMRTRNRLFVSKSSPRGSYKGGLMMIVALRALPQPCCPSVRGMSSCAALCKTVHSEVVV